MRSGGGSCLHPHLKQASGCRAVELHGHLHRPLSRAPSHATAQGYDTSALELAAEKSSREQAMGAQPLACVAVMLLLALLCAMQHSLLLLLHDADAHAPTSAASAAASVYTTGIPAAAAIASGILADRHYQRRTIYSLTHACTVHYKQTSHAVAALAAVSSACALALLLSLHPLSPMPTPLHPALLHLLLVTRTLAASALIAPSITSIARLTAPYALPLSLATMLLGHLAVHVMQQRCVRCGIIAQLLERSLWPCVAGAVGELLLCCAMVLVERQAAVSAHVRLLSYEFQRRGQQVAAAACRPADHGDRRALAQQYKKKLATRTHATSNDIN